MVATAEARPTPSQKTDDGEFLDFGYVPVWCEHTRPDGVTVGRDDLERVADANNSRIDETGDFCPAVIGHRKDPDDPGSQGEEKPEVVGYFGPYRMGEIGKKNKKAAIFARMRIYKEDAEKVKKNPRLSVEYYPSDDYFDPISLLGAETPQLDLGLHYSRNGGRSVIRYSRAFQYGAFPGGSNTFVPKGGNMDDDDNEPITYAKEPGMQGQTLSPEDIQAIAASLEAIIDAKIEQRLGMMSDPTSDPNALAPVADVAAPPALDAGAPPALTEGAPPPAADAGDAPPPAKTDDDEDKPKQYQRIREQNVQYARQIGELKLQYQRLQGEHNALKGTINGEKEKARKAVRYQRYQEMQAEGFHTVDPEKEATRSMPLDDEQFEVHFADQKLNYSRAPVGVRLPGSHNKPESYVRDDKSEQYSKRAREICDQKIESGEAVDYTAALEEAKKEIEAKTKVSAAA